MNNNIGNISFGANIVTNMRGRNGIMKDVAQQFAKRTKGLNGTIELTRGGRKYPNALILNYKDMRRSYLITDYGDIMGEALQNKTPEATNKIADSLVKIFRVLRADSTYEKFVSKLKKHRNKTMVALDANKKSLAKIQDARYETSYISVINQNKQKLETIEKHLSNSKGRYLSMLNSIAGDNLRSKQCVETIKIV